MTFKKHVLKKFILLIGDYYITFVDNFIIKPIMLCIIYKKD